jgi:hypothetical protein
VDAGGVAPAVGSRSTWNLSVTTCPEGPVARSSRLLWTGPLSLPTRSTVSPGRSAARCLRVHVLHAAREAELDVAGDRDLAAQAQLADERAEVVLGVGAQEVAAGAAGEGVEEEEVGAGAEGDGLDAGAGERALEVAQQLVGGELAGGGAAVAEVDDDALGSRGGV